MLAYMGTLFLQKASEIVGKIRRETARWGGRRLYMSQLEVLVSPSFFSNTMLVMEKAWPIQDISYFPIRLSEKRFPLVPSRSGTLTPSQWTQ